MAATADVEPAAKGELTPLCAAAKDDNAAEVRALVAAGTDVDARTPPFGWTALHNAAGHGAASAIEALLEERADPNARATDGETPLHLAAQGAQEGAVRLLVASRADPGLASEDKETPLHVAIQHVGGKPTGSISALLQLRADPTARNSEGHDAMACAALFTNRAKEISDILKAECPSLAQTDAGGDDSLRRKAFDEATGGAAEFDKALDLACKRGQAHLVDQMLSMSPNPKAAAQGALVTAAAGGRVDVLEALVKAGADVHASDASVEVRAGAGETEDMSTTPLIAAAGEGALKTLRWLLEQRCDASAASKDLATPLMAAAIKGSAEGAELLLAARADVEQRADRGWTALMVACQAGRVGVAKQLLDARAEIGCRSEDGCTARELAQGNGHGELVKLLDVRVKMNARMEARKGTGSKDTGAEGGAADDRDLDSLLADLGEPTAASGKAKAKKKSAKAKGAAK